MKKKNSILSYNKMQNLFCFLFIMITFVLIAFRITLHADLYDEIINLSVAHRISLGQLPFYECWESYQSGDLLLVPFLYVYENIFGTTSGIVLYSRIIYLIAITIISVIMYRFCSKFVDKRKSIFIGCSCLCFQLYGLYYLWYDVVATFLLLIGCILLVETLINTKFKKIKLFVAGMVHAIMALSYPSLVLLALCIAILFFLFKWKENGIKTTLRTCVWYYAGAFLVIGLFSLYIFFIVGIGNFQSWITIVFGYASTAVKIEKSIIRDIIISFIKLNEFLLIPTFLLIYLYFKALVSKKYIKWLCVLVIVFAFLNQLFFVAPEYRGVPNHYAYIAVWAPFFYYLIKEKIQHNKILLLFLWLPSVLTSVFIALTSAYGVDGPVKAWQAFFPAAIVSIIFICKLLDESMEDGIVKENNYIIIVIMIVCMLINCYGYYYLNPNENLTNATRVKSGVYKGIKTSDPMILNGYSELQSILEPYFEDNDTILAGAVLRPVYLMSFLKPITSSVALPCEIVDGKLNWDYTLKYFDYFNKYPDIIVLEKSETNSYDIQQILEKKYQNVYDQQLMSYHVVIYIKK